MQSPFPYSMGPGGSGGYGDQTFQNAVNIAVAEYNRREEEKRRLSDSLLAVQAQL
jgi:hypothetical protein